VQWALVVVSVIGALWLLAIAALAYLQLDQLLEPPDIRHVPVPTAMLIGGALLGLLLASFAGAIARIGARRRARRARTILDSAIAQVADVAVIEPIRAEIEVRRELCATLHELLAREPRST
jgi:hypothetical protein